METRRLRRWRTATLLVLTLSLGGLSWAQQPAQPGNPDTGSLPLFAIVITTGPSWDASRSAQDQAYFREHSANLRKLRDAGHLVMGARYSDKGLVVLAAENVAAARAMMNADPSMKAGTFQYEAHPFSVFYAGSVGPRPAPAASPAP